MFASFRLSSSRPVVGRLSVLFTACLAACAQWPLSVGGADGAVADARPVAAQAASAPASTGSAASAASLAKSASAPPPALRASGAVRPAAAAASAAGPAPMAGASAPATGPTPTPVAAPQPGQPPAFAAVIKDAKRVEGTFNLWRKEDKVWMELAEKDFGAPLFLSPKMKTGIGEAGLFGGLMASRWSSVGRPQLVEFRRYYNQVQLLARNTEYTANPGTPESRAVAVAFSPSLIGSTAVASQPHPERKTVLVDVNALLMGDWLGLGAQLQRAYRQGYGYDPRNSMMLDARAKTDAVVFEMRNHYATAGLAMPQPGTPPGAPVPTVPGNLPDARSLFLEVHYSLSRLPETPMTARRADPRVGHFVTVNNDFADDLQRTPRQRFVNRWRLDKQDPAAELSEPVKPIVYWIDRSVPLKYRDAMTAGILEWNKAYEKVGFKNAIVVKVQPDDADWDTLDMGVASVRWMTNGDPQFGAIGPSHVDPRSGEILDADVGFESLSSRNLRAARAQILATNGSPTAQREWLQVLQASDALHEVGPFGGVGLPAYAGGQATACQYADVAGEQLSYALDVLDAQGLIDPQGPEAEAFVQAYIKDVTMHEIGHTLGLRHNFRASRVYKEAQISDAAFGKDHALTGSVMEYAPINLPRPGQPLTTPFQTTLGPYDYWAIEYAYRPFPLATESAQLALIAGRSAEPGLAFGTDEDNFLGIDPESLHFDLGDDPIAFGAKRIDIARDLLKRLETRPLRPTEDYAVLRRVVSYALRDLGRTAGVLARQIGGVRTLRDFPGTGRDPLQPVPAATQRAALDLLADAVLSSRGLQVSASLQRRLAPDFLERGDAALMGSGSLATDYSPQQALFDLQRALLAQLMSDGLAQRLLDSEGKTSADGAKADLRQASGVSPSLRLGELYQRLDREVWSELAAGSGDILSARRELQREYINRLSALLLRPTAMSRADARSLLRVQAQGLLTRLESSVRQSRGSLETQAHLKDSAETLREALTAKMQRAG